jgi:ubiquitin-like-conjugating enzyme ATG3
MMSNKHDGSVPQNAMTAVGYLRAAREWAYPTLTKSLFLEKGVLTPEEFVIAGDELVFRCPTWSWEIGDPAKAKSYLPPDKQYLVTRQMPCQARVADLEFQMNLQQLVGQDEDGDGSDNDWLVPQVMSSHRNVNDELDDDFDIVDENGEIVNLPVQSISSMTVPTNGYVDYADIDDFEDRNILQDDAAAALHVGSINMQGAANHLLRVRTYDLSITYDKYYQTPRLWMVGKTAEGQPLTGVQMLEDVMSDYANKTVTIEGHPHVTGPHASIHPCQHAKVMKTIVRNLIRATEQKRASQSGIIDSTLDEGPSVEMYLFIFLKFVSSIIPTINYDFTMDVAADTRN